MKSVDVSCRDCAYWCENEGRCRKDMQYFIRWVADECQFFDGRHKGIYDWD